MNNVNQSTLNIASRTTNELYTVSVPANLLNFCNFDFTYFMEESSRLCRECMRTGEYPVDEANSVKNAITNCHKYFENNIRGIFEKVVVDSWVEYICRQGEMGTTTLWNTFSKCKNPFQRTVFQRLSEYRSHRAINQWVNLLKMQEYARRKIDFIFGGKLNNVNEAVGRLNLFDLMFSVAANEQGYSLDAIGSVKVFKGGRLPNAPFVFGGAAKEVVRNLFKEVHFADKLPYMSRYEGPMSDWEAMDSFAVIKGHLPEHSDNVANTIMKSMARLPETIYLPSGFKAMIDLEIDTLVNNGAFLQRCKRCKEYYIRDDYYNSDYCDNVHRDGTTCREIMENALGTMEPLTQEQLAYIKETSEAVYREMSAKLSMGLSQRDFSEWLGNFNVIRNKVLGSEADISVFDEFVRYSREYNLPAKVEAQVEVKEEKEELTEDNRVVKPYQFTRIDRKELVQQGLLKSRSEEKSESPVIIEAADVPPAPPVARIIRGAHPTSYHEIPVGNEKHDEGSVPKVFKAEDFATVTATAAAEAESAGEAARAAIQNMEVRETSAKEPAEKESEKVHLPELDEFTELAELQRERKSPPKVKLPDFGLQEQTKLPETERHDKVRLYDREEDHGLPEFGRQDNRVDLPDFGQKRKTQQPDFVVEDDDTDFVNLEDRLEKTDVRKPAEMNRAARAVNAYKTVNDMPKAEEQAANKQDEAAARVMDDFAKILDNIERNDGFDEDDVPLDPEGIPLSHKTKHVMDAIMKNTRVSPSLIYGRRQAAEQNVLIDEDYRKNEE